MWEKRVSAVSRSVGRSAGLGESAALRGVRAARGGRTVVVENVDEVQRAASARTSPRLPCDTVYCAMNKRRGGMCAVFGSRRGTRTSLRGQRKYDTK